MAYYDRIVKQWHTATGYKGGAFKELILLLSFQDTPPWSTLPPILCVY